MMTSGDPRTMDPLPAADPDTSACVIASAGTGKTWLLVTRIVRLLLNGAAADSILAVTFTRPAAAEMQARLMERLRILASPVDTDVDAQLKLIGLHADHDLRDRARCLYDELLSGAPGIRISTFHAFCQDLLKRFPMEADVPPGFELTEQTGILETGAWDALIDEATRTPDAPVSRVLEDLFVTYGSLHSTRAVLIEFLQKRMDWWAYTSGQPEPAEWAIRKLHSLLGIIDGEQPESDFFTPSRIGELEEFAELLSRHPTTSNQNHHEQLLSVIHDSNSDSNGDDARFALAKDCFLTKANDPRKRKTSKALEKNLGPDDAARFVSLHEELTQACLDVLDRRNRIHTAHICRAWYVAGDRLLHHFQQLKYQMRVLDFSDLEWKASCLLNDSDNAHWIQYKLDARINHLLIDEFQDTNPTQWQLVLPLLEEMTAAETELTRTVFLVGDEKQSIYRFRRADPELLRHANDWLSERLRSGVCELHRSRRSAQAIIDCVNSIFSTPDLAAHYPVFPQHETHLHGMTGKVTVLPLIATPDEEETVTQDRFRDPLETARTDEKFDAHILEANQIAGTIRDLIDIGTVIMDGDLARHVRYGDIMILLRRRTIAAQIEQALRERNIPYIGANRGTLLHSLEIRDLEALLQVLILPRDNLKLAQVLRSPIFSASNDDLVTLASTAGTDWMERLKISSAGLPEDAPLTRATRLLTHWRERVGRIPVHDLLDRILFEGDIVSRFVAAWPPESGPAIRANLARFVELALDIDSGRYPSLPNFLARLEELRQHDGESPDEAPPESGAGNRVRIMTVHAAKGLEAPVVFLADMTGSKEHHDTHSAIVDWPSGESRPTAFLLAVNKAQRDQTTQEILKHHKQKEMREKANLLYVALTRARQLLFVTGTETGSGKPGDFYGTIRAACTGVGVAHEDGRITISSGAATEPETPDHIEPSPEPTPEPGPELCRPLSFPHTEQEHAPEAPVEDDTRAALRGTVIHRLLQQLSADRLKELDPDMIRSSVAYEFGLPPDDRDLLAWTEEASNVISSPDLAEIFSPDQYDAAYNEVAVIYTTGSRPGRGVIDRLVTYPDELLVVDYKTRRDITPENAQAVAETYREQLSGYCRAVAGMWPQKKVRAAILFTNHRILVGLQGIRTDTETE